jgi:hypothetical protein
MKHLVIAVCIVLLTQAFSPAQDTGGIVVERSPSDPSRFLCDIGFAKFTTPKAWNPNRSGKPTYAILTHESEKYPQITKMISVDAGKPVGPNSKAMAEALARKWNGRVLNETVLIDGEVAYRVKCKPNPNRVQPVDCIVIVREGRGLMLMAGALKTGETDAALNDLVASWKWKQSNEPSNEPKSR